MAFTGFGGPNTAVGTGGLNPFQTKKPRTAYDFAGQPVDAGDVEPSQWQPNTAYPSNAQFVAPPPSSQTQYSSIPSTRSHASRTPVTQSAFEQQDILKMQQDATRALAELNQQGAGDERAHEANLAQMQGQGAMDLAKRQAKNEMALLNQRSNLAEQAFQSRFGMLSGQGTAPAQVSHGTSLQGNEEAARNAAFARARDVSGNTANSALAALRGLMEDRGLTGSTLEAARSGQILGNAGAGVQDFINKQLMSDLNRSAEIADMEYQGGITQRGQDMAAKQALLNLINTFGSVY